MKKHIFVFTVLASMLCSCQNRVEYTPSRKEGLANYAYALFYDVLATPAIAMDVAYEFQNFLDLNDEQRKDHIFANMVVQYDLNSYALLFYDDPGYLVINTNGFELDTPGKKWDIYVEPSKLFEYFKIQSQFYGSYSEYNISIECREYGQWDLSGSARDGMCRLSLADDTYDERVWLARSSGSETEAGATGIRSDYCTYNITQTEEDFVIGFQKHAASDIQAYTFNGVFQVQISSFDEIKERAVILGKPGFAINCITETLK